MSTTEKVDFEDPRIMDEKLTTAEFLFRLRDMGVELWVNEDKLRFNAPDDMAIPSLREELARRKTEIVRFFAESASSIDSTIVPLQPISGDGVLPVSFSQERLWFLSQMDPDSATYVIPLGLRMQGKLNVDAFERCLNEIVRRHKVLRTTFKESDGSPEQVVSPPTGIRFPLVDLEELPVDDREAEVQRLINEEVQRPFDLSQGPLLRAKLLRLGEQEHVLILTMHHIITDAWSMAIFTRELTVLYEAFNNEDLSPLPELPIQYADFAAWQRQWLQGEVLEKQLSYWRKQLDGVPVLQHPTDHPRPAVQTYRGATKSFVLSERLKMGLKRMSRDESVTMFMTLLAAFYTLLYRYTGQEDITVGSPVANRTRSEIENLIGFFVNTLVLRSDMSGNPTFRELIRRVQRVALGAYEHQDLPFEKLVEELNPERDMSHSPLFQVMFNMINVKEIAFELHNLSVEHVSTAESESKFDLSLHVMEIASGIQLSLVYNTDLFNSWRMAQMLKQYQMLLESIVSDPDQRISELSLLTEAERHQILVDWNDTAADYPEDKCIHTLFETQAELSPEAVAVIFGDEQLSYHELNCRANQLAHYLRKHSIGSEEVVGICMERSLEMVIGLLAILKAGGAYVALEPDFPGARLSFMLEDTKPGLLLTQERLLEKIPEYSGEFVCLDRDGRLFQNEQESNLDLITTPEDLAYVTYTSGSTGKPKGILTRHRSVVQNLHALIHNYSLSATDIVLQIPSFSFDASVRDMFGPLLAGARIVVVRNDDAKDPSALVAKIAENHVTCILSIVPSQLTQLVEAGSHENFSFAALRHTSAAGEPLPMGLCKRVQDVFGCSVVNQYGPTECTMISSYHRVVDMDGNRNIALIGRPIANTQFYILDDHLNPVPVGVAGEAYIGGLGVSKGYLNLPDLSAEKFIPNPFSNEPEARLYRTGDMVRYLPDGTMEFLGRRDFQVKLRGVRIELGEVEATLCLHPSVSEAVVVAREDRPGDKRLVAYMVAAAGKSAPSTGVLRAILQESLPDYMIPSSFVYLDVLPLTPNGKVDRRALPKPETVRQEPRESFLKPRDELELQLTKIWEKVLGVKNVGLNDNFFDLGGHSLLAVRLFALIQKRFGKDLPLTILFQAPTINQLANICRQEGFAAHWTSLVPIQPDGTRPPFFCTHGCTGRVLHFHSLARQLGPDQPFYGLSAQGRENDYEPHNQIEEMASHYIKELQTIQSKGPYFIGGSGDGGAIALEMAHQLESQGQKIGLVVLIIPSHAQLNPSQLNISTGRKYMNDYRRLVSLLQSRPLMPAIKNSFFKRILYRWKIFHRFIPIEIHRQWRFLKSFFEARIRYKPEAYHGRITCILLDEYASNPQKGLGDWQSLSLGGLDVRFVPGTKISMWREPHVQILAKKLTACLNEAQKNS